MIDRKQLAEQIAELVLNELNWATMDDSPEKFSGITIDGWNGPINVQAGVPGGVMERRKKEALRTIRALVRAGLEEVYNEMSDAHEDARRSGEVSAFRYSLSILRLAIQEHGRTGSAMSALYKNLVDELEASQAGEEAPDTIKLLKPYCGACKGPCEYANQTAVPAGDAELALMEHENG